jgi:hypothetical protein
VALLAPVAERLWRESREIPIFAFDKLDHCEDIGVSHWYCDGKLIEKIPLVGKNRELKLQEYVSTTVNMQFTRLLLILFENSVLFLFSFPP